MSSQKRPIYVKHGSSHVCLMLTEDEIRMMEQIAEEMPEIASQGMELLKEMMKRKGEI